VQGKWAGRRGRDASGRLGPALILTAAFMVVLDNRNTAVNQDF